MIPPLLFFSLLLALFLVLAWLDRRLARDSKMSNLLQEVSKALKLDFKAPDGSPGEDGQKIGGTVNGRPVTVKRVHDKKSKRDYLEIKSPLSLGVPGEIYISAFPNMDDPGRAGLEKDIKTGDGNFDRSVHLKATNPGIMLILMDRDTREMLKQLRSLTLDFEISNDHIRAEAKFVTYAISNPYYWLKRDMSLEPESHQVIALVKLILALDEKLSTAGSLGERCSANIHDDPERGVRINNIRALTSLFPRCPGTMIVLEGSLKNSYMEVQLEAARHLDEGGLDHLLGILESWATSDLGILIEIVGIFEKKRYKKSIPILKKLYGTGRGKELKIAILDAFSTFGDKSLAPFLLEELDNRDPAPLAAAIQALGTCGGVEAVEKIVAVGKAVMYPSVERAAKEAVAKIQSRLGHVEKGWLSLDELQEWDGALSPAEDKE